MNNVFIIMGVIGVLVCGAAVAADGSVTETVAADGATSEAGESAAKPQEEMIKLQFPPNLEVKVLVQYVSKRLGVNILYDEQVGRKQVTILAAREIPKSSLMPLFTNILKSAGMQLVDTDTKGWKRIIAIKSLLDVTGKMQTQPGFADKVAATVPISQVFILENIAPSEAESLIKPFLSAPGGSSFLIPKRPMLIVSDYAGNVRRIAQVIRGTPYLIIVLHGLCWAV